MIKFACAKCGKKISVDDKYAGKKGKCPGCGETVAVPGQATTIKFKCTHCGQSVKVPDSYAGKKGKCPKCKQPIEVPAKKAESVPTARPEPKPTSKPQAVVEPSPEPVTASTVPCVMCGHAIPVPEGASEAPVQCPECGCYVDPVSGGIAAGPDEAESQAEAEVQEESYEEGADVAPSPRASSGPDRRLIMILGGAAVVVVVAAVGLIVFLKLTGPKPAERPTRSRAPREVVEETDSASQPVGPAVEPTEQPAPTLALTPAPTEAPVAVASANVLRFAPTPGTKRTMQIGIAANQSVQKGGQTLAVTANETYGFDVEVMPTAADGTIPLKVVLATVQIQSGVNGMAMGQYDSTKPEADPQGLGQSYDIFIEKPFTMSVSPQGQIVALGLDELFAAVAVARVHAEGGMDRLSGPSEARVLAMKKQLEQFPMMSRDKVAGLLGELVLALPQEPIQTDATWTAPIFIAQVDRRLEMAAVHTVTAADDSVCTIRTQGRRGETAGPLVQEMGQLSVRYTLGGSSDATLVVDRKTGWLLSKEQKVKLSGQMEESGPGVEAQAGAMPVDLEITTTVVTVGRSAKQPPVPEATPAVQLRFTPAPGARHVMRVRTVLTSMIQGTDADQDSIDDSTFMFDVEAAQAGADGIVPLTVTLTGVRRRTDQKGQAMIDYDSTRPEDRDSSRGRLYGPFIGKPFAIRVSSGGQIVGFDLDELFRRVAEESLQAQEERMKERSEPVKDDRPREERLRQKQEAYKWLPVFGGNALTVLLGDLVSALPDGPVQKGSTWDRPVPVAQIKGLAIPAAYSLTVLDQNVCTVQAQGQRSQDEAPIVEDTEEYTTSRKLGGTYQAMLTLDRQTGWLLGKQQKTSFGGQCVTTGKGIKGLDSTVLMTYEIVTTVATVK